MTTSQILKKAATNEGFSTVLALLEKFSNEGSVPAYCVKCGEYVDHLEPDATDGNCEECGSATAQSVLVLAGVI